MKIKVSIIIRTYNEEDWIRHCLESLQRQSEKNFEIIIVDNESKDNTLKIAKSFNIKKIYKIKKYLPGKSLNIGCANAKGEFLVFLSSHCLPENKDWLKNLLKNFKNKKVAGVYGKQSPLKFSGPKDIRDLYITFGNEKKIQKKDYFFHNANSAIRRELWKKNKFNEKLTNIEDREWGKRIIQSKYWLIYEPKANVFHYHGIHHGSNSRRLQTTIDVINKIEDNKLLSILPSSLRPENINLLIIIQFSNYEKKEIHNKTFISLTKYIEEFRKNPNVIFIKPKNFPISLVPKNYSLLNAREKNFDLSSTLKKCIKKSISQNFYSDFVLYLNADYIFRSKNFFKKILDRACSGSYDSLVPAFKNYSTNIFYDNDSSSYKIYGSNLKNRKRKTPIYSSVYGVGCITKTKIVTQGMLISSKNIGLVPIKNKIDTLRLSDFESKNYDLINNLYNEKKK